MGFAGDPALACSAIAGEGVAVVRKDAPVARDTGHSKWVSECETNRRRTTRGWCGGPVWVAVLAESGHAEGTVALERSGQQ